jgi:hypothetical protein
MALIFLKANAFWREAISDLPDIRINDKISKYDFGCTKMGEGCLAQYQCDNKNLRSGWYLSIIAK